MSVILKSLVAAFLLVPSAVWAQSTDFPYSIAGKNWSEDIGVFTNGCVNQRPDGAPDCSMRTSPTPAEKACADIGGRLPTKEDYNELLNLVEAEVPGSTSDSFLTRYVNYNGWKVVRAAFNAQGEEAMFWTSTDGYVSWDGVAGSAAYVFGSSADKDITSPYYGSLYAAGGRGFAHHVRCISN